MYVYVYIYIYIYIYTHTSIFSHLTAFPKCVFYFFLKECPFEVTWNIGLTLYLMYF